MSAIWDGSINFSSYDQVESPDNYRGSAEMEAYRAERLAFCARHVEFIFGAAGIAPPVSVLEVGAGSSALLYAMEMRGVLERALAIELSRSRHEFAECWKRESGFSAVVNQRGDFSGAAMDAGAFDLFLCIDNTYSYIGPENPRYPALLAERAFAALKPGGIVIIETHNQEKVIAEMNGDERRLWRELPASNAFKFALYRQSFNRARNLIRSESIYLGRDGTERRKVELETAHTRASVEKVLSEAGFAELRFFGEYDATEFAPFGSDHLIGVARKPLA